VKKTKNKDMVRHAQLSGRNGMEESGEREDKKKRRMHPPDGFVALTMTGLERDRVPTIIRLSRLVLLPRDGSGGK